MSTSSSAGTSFAIEKVVVFTVAAATVAFGLIHFTGVLLAQIAGDSPPAFSPARALGVIQLEPYTPHTSPIAHLILMAAVLIGFLGSSKGQQVWASVERSILVIGPPGSGVS